MPSPADLRSGIGDEWVKIGAVKIFLDVRSGSQTAWMYEPYTGNRDNRGICRMPKAEFDDIVRKATAHGLSICSHAIGDAAVGMAIGVLGKHRKRFPHNQPPRIEHLQLLHPKDLKKLARAQIIASMQPSHLLTDRDIADRKLGQAFRQRLRLPYALGSWRCHGVRFGCPDRTDPSARWHRCGGASREAIRQARSLAPETTAVGLGGSLGIYRRRRDCGR
jgi:predicted amidohydrolase YtcJ